MDATMELSLKAWIRRRSRAGDIDETKEDR